MDRRHFLKGFVTSVASTSIILQATPEEIRQFGVQEGDDALVHQVARPNIPVHPEADAMCTISFTDGTSFSFAVADIGLPPPQRSHIDLSLMNDDKESYVMGLQRPSPITLTPRGPIIINQQLG